MTITKTNLRNAPALIAAREDFDCNGTLTGYAGGAPMSGRLPVEYLKDFAYAANAADFYVVMSYATPIAWYAEGIWYVPATRYSVTTSRHQGRLYMIPDADRMGGNGYR